MSTQPPTSERPRLNDTQRRRFQAAYYLILDYCHQQQRAAGQETRQIHPLTDRTF